MLDSNSGWNGPISVKFRLEWHNFSQIPAERSNSSQILTEMIQFHRNRQKRHITISKKKISPSIIWTLDLLNKGPYNYHPNISFVICIIYKYWNVYIQVLKCLFYIFLRNYLILIFCLNKNYWQIIFWSIFSDFF